MRDLVIKMHVLWVLVSDVVFQWWSDFATRDLDERQCCPGDPVNDGCGCMGSTWRDMATAIIGYRRR